MLRRRGRRDDETVDLEIRPGVSRELPAWMTEVSVCLAMSLGRPQLSIAALSELRAVLRPSLAAALVGGSLDGESKGISNETYAMILKAAENVSGQSKGTS